MIDISGYASRVFTFPAPLEEAVAFYTDFARQLALLPNIRIVRRFAPGSHRLLYHAVEAGVYDVRLYCDVQAQYNARRHLLIVEPAHHHPPVAQRVSLRSLLAPARYSSSTRFHAAGSETGITVDMTLEAVLPLPWVLRMAPAAAVQAAADRIAQQRMEGITAGYVRRSIAAYRAGRLVGHPGRKGLRED